MSNIKWAFKTKLYRLEWRAVPVYEISEAGEQKRIRTIRRDEINGVLISSVFLGIDHGISNEDRPVLFETMVFGIDGKISTADEYTARFTNAEDMLEYHEKLYDEIFGKE